LELEASVRGLEADVAALSSLERIERESQRLGLVPPKSQETVEVNVPWAGGDENRLPSRYAPPGEDEAEEDSGAGGSIWSDVMDLLPFR
jgi:hypothetical protein